jgi:HD superfamily phosphohydrolase
VDEEQRVVVLAAALLHDVGHGPFSHAFEKITGDKHEKRTLEIITTPGTEVHTVLTTFDSELPDHLKVFFDEDLEEEVREGAIVPPYLTQIVSSQLDADRFDYLLRDSYATGAEYGRFDIEWMLQHIDVDGDKGRFFLHGKAVLAAETYIFALSHVPERLLPQDNACRRSYVTASFSAVQRIVV